MNFQYAQLQLPPVKKLDEVLLDFQHIRDGNVIHYFVDPHEIYDFCFPIDPSKVQASNIEKVSDHQIALYEVFNLLNVKPILLAMYSPEVDSFLNYFKCVVNRAYSQSEMLESLLREANISSDQTPEDNKELWKYIDDNFNMILAATMGILSLGVSRLEMVVNKRIQREPVVNLLTEYTYILKKYNITPIARAIYEYEVNELINGKKYTPADRQRRLIAAKIDAQAIDFLIYLNQAFYKEYIDGRIPQRHLFVYISDAEKNNAIFNLSIVRNALPKLGDISHFSFWRSRIQLLAYVVFKGEKGSSIQSLEQSISNIIDVKNLLEKLDKLPSSFKEIDVVKCLKCKLGGGHIQSCEWYGMCSQIQNLAEWINNRKLKIMKNLGVMATIGRYNQLLKANPQAKHKFVLELFRNVYYNRKPKLVFDKMRNLGSLISLQADFSKTISSGFQSGPDVYHLRWGKDDVTSAVQYLPIYPQLKTDRYKNIISDVIDYYEKPAKLQLANISLIEKAYAQFIYYETELTELDLEHELVRCFLYLALPTPDSDRSAFEHAKIMLNDIKVTKNKEMQMEFRYVIGWAARRLKLYQEADRILTQSIKKSPRDARFFHGLVLNIYSWRKDKEYSPKCHYEENNQIMFTKKAIKYYKAHGEKTNKLVGACYNNMAYFYSTLSEDSKDPEALKFLRHAKTALHKVMKYIPHEEWIESYPEFLHTEANIVYLESIHIPGEDDKKVKNNKIKNLLSAEKFIKTAIDAYPKARYYELKNKIINAINMLSPQIQNNPRRRSK